jgi:tetratricopeptide (TPR) repeat protein
MARAYFNRGLIRLQQADYSRANDDFSCAIKLQPDWRDALTNRAIARKELKNFQGAITDLDAVIEGSESPVRALFLRAEINELDGRPSAAKDDRAQGMKLQPVDELGWSTRGYARMASEPAAALDDFNEAIKLNPRSREALINKSIVLSESLNRQEEAVKALDQLLEYYPDHFAGRAGRGVLLARLGKCDRARRDAEECLKHDRSPFFLYQVAGLYAQISRHEREPDARREALLLLGAALRKGFSDLELLKTDHDLDPIREDSEFKRLFQIAAGLEKSPAK